MDVKDADLGFSGLSRRLAEKSLSGAPDRRLLLGLKDAAYRTRPSHHPRWSGIWPDGEPTGDRRIDAPAVQPEKTLHNRHVHYAAMGVNAPLIGHYCAAAYLRASGPSNFRNTG
jgi:hypothetical protein